MAVSGEGGSEMLKHQLSRDLPAVGEVNYGLIGCDILLHLFVLLVSGVAPGATHHMRTGGLIHTVRLTASREFPASPGERGFGSLVLPQGQDGERAP